jgi:hypothetical protein
MNLLCHMNLIYMLETNNEGFNVGFIAFNCGNIFSYFTLCRGEVY